jgi:hypothetical protein
MTALLQFLFIQADRHPIAAWAIIVAMFASFFWSAFQQRMAHQQRCGLHHVTRRSR